MEKAIVTKTHITEDKLALLLKEADVYAEAECEKRKCVDCTLSHCKNSLMASYLIQNGVIAYTWIDVHKNPPRENGSYFVYACDEGSPLGEGIWYENVVVIAEYSQGEWFWYEGASEYDLTDIVTHWKPLHFPQPPKED